MAISNIGADPDPINNASPAWSPDSSRIAWSGSTGIGSHIHVTNADGTGRTVISTVAADPDPTTNLDPTWSPDGTRIAWSGDNHIYVANADGTGRTVISTVSADPDPTTNLDPTWSPDGTRIAWSGVDAGSSRQIYVAASDGSGRAPISTVSADPDPTTNLDPTWSPDGTRIAWSGVDAGSSRQIYVAASDGSGRAPISTVSGGAPNVDPAWSPDSARIAWSRALHIVVANADGTSSTDISSVGTDPDPAANLDPTWSPDGTRLAWQAADATLARFVFVAASDGSARMNLSAPATIPIDNRAPRWSPDGSRLAWSGFDGSTSHIYVGDADGTRRTPISIVGDSLPTANRSPAWAPDGTRIAWSGRRGVGDEQIYVAGADGSGRTTISDVGAGLDPTVNDQPAWSPDSTRVAWSGGSLAASEIYVSNADGSARTIISTVGADLDPTNNRQPVWSPDGTRIAWSGHGSATNQIYVANADGSGRIAISPGDGPVDASSPAWSPDGSGIAWSGSDGTNLQIYVSNRDGSGRTEISSVGAGADPTVNVSPAWSPDGTRIAWSGFDLIYAQLFIANVDGSARRVVGHRMGYSAPVWSPARSAPASTARFVPLAPTRVFDTRPGEPAPGPKGIVAPGGAIDVQVTGVAGIPANAIAVALNVTATQSTAAGFVTVWPTGSERPLASSLNLTGPDQTRPNTVIVPIGVAGRVSLFTQSGTHLLADATGYWTNTAHPVTSGRLVSLFPTRIFDTRPDEPAPGPKGLLAPGASIDVQITGVAGVPTTGVAAIVMNLTATEATGDGFVTAWPTGSTQPLASTLNLTTGLTAPNLLIVPVGSGGQITLFTQSGGHLLGDVTGYITDATASGSTSGLYVPLSPTRLFDTRPEEPAPGPKGFLAPGTTITTQITGLAGVPSTGTAAIIVNLTATSAETGFITTWPAGAPQPLASTLNLTGPQDTRPNTAIIPLGTDGQLHHFNQSPAHLLADTTGYITN